MKKEQKFSPAVSWGFSMMLLASVLHCNSRAKDLCFGIRQSKDDKVELAAPCFDGQEIHERMILI